MKQECNQTVEAVRTSRLIQALVLGAVASGVLAQGPVLERVVPSSASPGAIAKPVWRDSVDPFDPTYRPPPRKFTATAFAAAAPAPKARATAVDRSVVMFDQETGVYDVIADSGKADRGTFLSELPRAGIPEGSVPTSVPTNWAALLSPVVGDALKEYPGRAMCRIVSRYVANDGTDRYRVGSGTMVDAGVILTSGGMVYEHGSSGVSAQFMAESWILPGWLGLGGDRELTLDDYTENFGWARGTAYGVAASFIENSIDSNCVGFIRLSRNSTRSVGAITGWLGWRSEACGGLGNTYTNYGYPQSICGSSPLDQTRLYTWTDSVDECPGFFNLGYFMFYTNTDCYRRFWMGMNGSSLFKPTQPYYVEGIIHDVLLTNDMTYGTPLWDEFNTGLATARDVHRGSTFDFEPFKYRTPEFLPVVRQGRTLMGGTVLISNTTNDDPNPRTITLHVYLSSNPTISAQDTLLGTFNYSSVNFAPMEVKELVIPELNIPFSAPTGIQYVGVIIDGSEDSNPSNNETNGWDTQRIDVDPCSPADAPGAFAASDGTLCNAVRLTWTPAAFSTGVNIYRGTSSNFAAATLIGSDTTPPYDDATAAAGTTYHYWLKSTSPCGDSTGTVTDQGRRESSVSAIANVNASSATFCDRVRITWNAAPNADFYQVYRGDTAVFSNAVLQTSTTDLTYDDLAVTQGIGYRYWVVGYNECGAGSPGSGDVGGTATAVGNPLNLTGGTSTTCAARIQWQSALRADRYKVYRGTTNNFNTATQVTTVSTTSYSDTSAPAGASRFYWVRASNACGDSSPIGPVAASGIGARPAPANVNATDATTCTGSITLSWNPVANAGSYVIEQRDQSQLEFFVYLPVATVTAPATSITLQPPYLYNPAMLTVRAVDACGGLGLRSSETTGTPGPAVVPTNLQASALSECGVLTVSWDGMPTDTRYELRRNTVNSLGGSVLISATAANPYVDSTVVPGTAYYYFVTAISACGNSGFSSSATGTAAPSIQIGTQPQDVQATLGGSAQFSITQTGGQTYRWHLNGEALSDSQLVTGTQTATLQLASVSPSDIGHYTCVVTAACGSLTSDAGALTIEGFVCPADFNQDGGVDGGDIEAFFGAWELGDSTADVNFDGGVDGMDIEAFFDFWTAGGC